MNLLCAESRSLQLENQKKMRSKIRSCSFLCSQCVGGVQQPPRKDRAGPTCLSHLHPLAPPESVTGLSTGNKLPNNTENGINFDFHYQASVLF